MVLPEQSPTLDVLGPGFPSAINLGSDETRNELVDRLVVRNSSGFYIVVIEGHGDIPRIFHDVNDPGILRLKAFVTLQNARTHQSPHPLIRVEVNFGDASFNVQESDWLVLVHQSCEVKKRPSILRTRIRSEEYRQENREFPPCPLMACYDSCDLEASTRSSQKLCRPISHTSFSRLKHYRECFYRATPDSKVIC